MYRHIPTNFIMMLLASELHKFKTILTNPQHKQFRAFLKTHPSLLTKNVSLHINYMLRQHFLPAPSLT
ncbi:hypothetical protein NSMM_350030 [Nitrosomonas mobilis]|uniref:Uncharacterized protein n=1 Tax=Nitrosomonas mobilis TaxID=51642 RepID=A0A1G5SD86_9PROT|nr:hypothetical protein NSMM_350030 [Nitrosomonas mobilis]